jgi:hypothetical protein
MPTCLVAPAQGSSGAATWGAPELPHAPWPRFSPPGSGQLQNHHVPHGSSYRHQTLGQLRDRHVPLGSSSHLLTQGIFEAVMCPVDRIYELRAIKVNKYPLTT